MTIVLDKSQLQIIRRATNLNRENILVHIFGSTMKITASSKQKDVSLFAKTHISDFINKEFQFSFSNTFNKTKRIEFDLDTMTVKIAHNTVKLTEVPLQYWTCLEESYVKTCVALSKMNFIRFIVSTSLSKTKDSLVLFDFDNPNEMSLVEKENIKECTSIVSKKVLLSFSSLAYIVDHIDDQTFLVGMASQKDHIVFMPSNYLDLETQYLYSTSSNF